MNNRNRSLALSAGGLLVAAVVAGCTAATTGTNGTPGTAQAVFNQQDRLAKPLVNEVLATFANNRHRVNNTDNPTDDPNQLKNDITSFLTSPAGRSTAIQNVIVSVLVPDTMKADLSQTGEAAYLGLETGGATSATKSTFGGRKLKDDVVDISLGIIFGNTVPALGLAPDDGKEIPTLTSDNVDSGAKKFNATVNTFPYLAPAS